MIVTPRNTPGQADSRAVAASPFPSDPAAIRSPGDPLPLTRRCRQTAWSYNQSPTGSRGSARSSHAIGRPIGECSHTRTSAANFTYRYPAASVTTHDSR